MNLLNKNQMKTLLTFLFISITNITFCQTPSAANTKWLKLNDNQFSVEYPDDWDLDSSKQMGTSFILFSPVESEKDTFKENINLIIQDLKGMNIDLDQFAELSLGQIKSMVTNCVIDESKKIKNGSTEFHRIIYSGDQGVFHLQFEQYYIIQQEKAYVLTFVTEKTSFLKFKGTGEKILNSFLPKI